MNFPELKAAMARKNINIPLLAEMLKISKKTIYSRFSGETDFNLSEIRKIAEILELTSEDILIIFFAEKVA
jgi:predicted transcriptional regulator